MTGKLWMTGRRPLFLLIAGMAALSVGAALLAWAVDSSVSRQARDVRHGQHANRVLTVQLNQEQRRLEALLGQVRRHADSIQVNRRLIEVLQDQVRQLGGVPVTAVPRSAAPEPAGGARSAPPAGTSRSPRPPARRTTPPTPRPPHRSPRPTPSASKSCLLVCPLRTISPRPEGPR